MRLYGFQKDGVVGLHHGFKKHKVICLAWYTGAGKTNVFAELCKMYVDTDPNIKIGISAYLTTEIKEQVGERLAQFGLADHTHVFEAGRKPVPSKNIFVFNPQTIYKKPPDLKFDLLIIDESHAGLGTECLMLRKIMKSNCTNDTKILLVSATPWDLLAMKEFAGAPVLKRPLDLGMKDGLITDFRFHAEEAQITFKEEDFTRKGDLGKTAAQRNMAILKSACLGKMKYLIGNYDKQLGKKVLVICPPGNVSEVARTLADQVGGLAFLQKSGQTALKSHVEGWSNTDENLHKFKSDEDIRFLFTTNKCQVGFDMPELTSVIDLTMSRNIKVLAQRCGRVARKNGKIEKHYFYVYDRSLMRDRLEWLVATMIDFCLGAYDGWTTKSAKYRKTQVDSQWARVQPFSTTLKEVVAALRSSDNIKNRKSLAYVMPDGPPTKWTLDRAIEASKKWSSRTEMWEKQPALYKWFRLNAKAEMDRVFPLKNKIGKWNEESVVNVLKTGGFADRSRRGSLKRMHSGAYDWILKNKRHDLLDKYIPLKNPGWNMMRARAALKRINAWSEVRQMGGLRQWMRRNGGVSKYKLLWLGMVPQKSRAS